MRVDSYPVGRVRRLACGKKLTSAARQRSELADWRQMLLIYVCSISPGLIKLSLPSRSCPPDLETSRSHRIHILDVYKELNKTFWALQWG